MNGGVGVGGSTNNSLRPFHPFFSMCCMVVINTVNDITALTLLLGPAYSPWGLIQLKQVLISYHDSSGCPPPHQHPLTPPHWVCRSLLCFSQDGSPPLLPFSQGPSERIHFTRLPLSPHIPAAAKKDAEVWEHVSRYGGWQRCVYLIMFSNSSPSSSPAHYECVITPLCPCLLRLSSLSGIFFCVRPISTKDN